LKKFSSSIHSVSWNSMTFSVNDSILDRIPMNHPQKGTKAIVGDLLSKSKNAAELVQLLSNQQGSE
jgi:hypothetical protein